MNIWDSWLIELKMLPPESLHWEQVPEFLEAVAAIRDGKLAQRQSIWDDVRAALTALNSGCGDMLRRFEISEVAEWRAESCPAAEVAAVKASLDAFAANLEQRQTMARQMPGETALISEERNYWQQIAALDSDITRQFAELATVFGQPVARDPDSGLAVEASETRTGPSSPKPESDAVENDSEVHTADEPRLPYSVDTAKSSQHVALGMKEESELPETEPTVANDAAQHDSTESERETSSPPAANGSAPPQAIDVQASSQATVPGPKSDPQLPIAKPQRVAKPRVSHQTAPRAGLPPLWQIARALPETMDFSDQSRLFWGFVAANDLPAAYWLAYALKVQGVTAPLPDWVPRALQASLWLTSETDSLAADLTEVALRDVTCR